jgi:hypothetical protein
MMLVRPLQRRLTLQADIAGPAVRVYVHTERGLVFRAYRVGKVIVQDEREGGER